MAFYAIPTAGEPVQRFVQIMNKMVYGTPQYQARKAGQARAQHRLFLKREANKKLPEGGRMTRQRRRYGERKGLPAYQW